MRTTNFDALAAAAPLDRQASTVRDGSGDLYDKAHAGLQLVSRWFAPPAMKREADLSPPGREVLRQHVGTRFGRFTILGIWAGGNDKKRATWVCRCDCGYYEGRKIKGLQNLGDRAMCSHCLQTHLLQAAGRSDNTKRRREADAAMLDRLAEGAR